MKKIKCKDCIYNKITQSNDWTATKGHYVSSVNECKNTNNNKCVKITGKYKIIGCTCFELKGT